MYPWPRQFSLPDAPANEAIFDAIVSTYTNKLASMFVEHHLRELTDHSEGLADYIGSASQRNWAARCSWDYAFGRAHLSLKEGRINMADAAIRLGLHYAALGHPGTWCASMPATSIHFGGVGIEQACAVEVASTAGSSCVSIRCVDGAQVEWRDEGDRSWCTGARAQKLAGIGNPLRPIWLLTRNALPLGAAGGEIFSQCDPRGEIDSATIESVAAGLDCVRRNVPAYVTWIERVLRAVVVCHKQDSYRLVSGSWEDAPGLIHLSGPHAAIDIAEILVHECSHQYFYMLEHVGPLDDASDRDLYWSPPIRKKRPLSRVLMAYHALANTQILYDAVRCGGEATEEDRLYVHANQSTLREAIRALDEPLRNNPALTDLGRGLYEPLAELMDRQ